ncbi:MAG: protoheme IX farnesyltransferase, partial [Chloroflexi bacterium]|nr:protoheme IX farnesyltransferase [Chloroflexota bacterium]
STLVGGIPGALPPLGGWAAARGALSFEAWTLFAILFLWQMPHFFALAWMYREDYLRGGFQMLSARDGGGSGTAQQIVTFTLALLPVSLAPALLGVAGPIYFFGALALGLAFAGYAVRFGATRSNSTAGQFFKLSVLYLPVLLTLLMLNKGG